MAYAFYRSITVDHTLCGSGNSTTFPFLFAGTYAWLATVPNGGEVTNANGYDIIFALDIAGTMPLDFEIDQYVATSGLVAFWVNVPTLDASTDTVIYVLYKNAAITTFQGNVNATWNSDYRAVLHFPSTGSTIVGGTVTDSTANGNGLTTINGSPALAAGKIGQAFSGNGSSDAYTPAGFTSNLPSGAGPITLECWYQSANTGQTSSLGGVGANNVNGARFGLFVTPTIVAIEVRNNDVHATLTADTNWHHFVGVYPPGATDLSNSKIYIDGALQSISSNATVLNIGGIDLAVGTVAGAPGNNQWSGLIDEFRVSGVERNADWVLASFNNQNDPATFYALGAQTPTTPGAQFLGTGWPVATGTPQANGGSFRGVGWPIGTGANGGGFRGVGFPTGTGIGVVPASFQGIAWPIAEADTIAGQPQACVVQPASDPFGDEAEAQIF